MSAFNDSREPLKVLRCAVSAPAIGEALYFTPREVMELFHDGRPVGFFAKVWGEHLFRFTRNGLNHNGPNGGYPLRAVEETIEHAIHIRAFHDRILFQRNGNQGKGRSCSQQDVIDALEGLETFVLLDIRRFPLLDFYPLDTKCLLKFVHTGQLTHTGMSAKRFDRWVHTAFAVSFVPTSLKIKGWPPS